jgi:AcrR family transcriptional regulator
MSKRMAPDTRKEFILDIAKDLFSKNGYYDTQIHDIVTKAGISRGTVYQYFKNKDDIYLTLLENFYSTWEEEMTNGLSAEDLRSINATEYFRKRIKQSLSFFANDHKMSNIVLRNTPGLGKNFESVIKRLEKKIKDFISKDINLGIKNGYVDKNIDIDLTTELITGAVFRISHSYFIKNREQKKPEIIDDLTDKIVRIFSSGIFI